MPNSLKAGLAYFTGIFALGFAMGMTREVLLAQTLPRPLLVLIEVPMILMVAWFYALRLTLHYRLPATSMPRVTMGGVALICLLLAEAGLSIMIFERNLETYLAHYQTASALMGLFGQLVFAAIPVVQLHLSHSAES